MSGEMTRREFASLGLCAGAVAAVSLTTGCTPGGGTGEADTTETPSYEFGEATEMSKRVLVGYATRTGSTTGVAEAIGRTLGERGYAVDVKPLREKPSPAGYDAVVMGSAVNGGAWLPEAVSWVESNAGALKSVPVAAYCVHGMNAGADEKQMRKRLAYLDPVRELVAPAAEGFFLGKGPSEVDSSLIARWAYKAFGGAAEGDCRDWDAIAAWAKGLEL